jgi:outer membrane cobalamin receptor
VLELLWDSWVKIVLDGVPESTPDGTAKLGNIDVGLIERIEVLKQQQLVFMETPQEG